MFIKMLDINNDFDLKFDFQKRGSYQSSLGKRFNFQKKRIFQTFKPLRVAEPLSPGVAFL
jgi:hypothetical protein